MEKIGVRSAEKDRVSTCRLADEIAKTVIDVYKSLKLCRESQEVIAGIAATIDGSHLEVISVASGNKFNPSGSDKTEDGRVYDCHAEVLCRRAFKLWLLEEMRRLRNDDTRSKFFAISKNSTLMLKPNIHFFLYVSSAPCGNACIRRWGQSPKEVFREDLTRLEIPSDQHVAFHAFAKHEGQVAITRKGESNILSCSDKILKWDVVGLQGTTLNALVEKPLKLAGIIVGRKYVSVHAKRAFCCRLDTKGINQTVRQNLTHPVMMCTSAKFDEGIFAAADGESAVFDCKSTWKIQGVAEEELDGVSGRLARDKSESRLSRRNLRALITSLGLQGPSQEALELKNCLLEQLEKL